MNYDITILPTYSEDGSVVTVIFTNGVAAPIRRGELIDALKEYIRYLEVMSESEAN